MWRLALSFHSHSGIVSSTFGLWGLGVRFPLLLLSQKSNTTQSFLEDALKSALTGFYRSPTIQWMFYSVYVIKRNKYLNMFKKNYVDYWLLRIFTVVLVPRSCLGRLPWLSRGSLRGQLTAGCIPPQIWAPTINQSLCNLFR